MKRRNFLQTTFAHIPVIVIGETDLTRFFFSSDEEKFNEIKEQVKKKSIDLSLKNFDRAFSKFSLFFDDLNIRISHIKILKESTNQITISGSSKDFFFGQRLLNNHRVDIEAEFSLVNDNLELFAICQTRKETDEFSGLPGELGDLLAPLDLIKFSNPAFILASKPLDTIHSKEFYAYNNRKILLDTGITLLGFFDFNQSNKIISAVTKPIAPVLGKGPYLMSWNMNSKSKAKIDFILTIPKEINIERIFNLRTPRLVIKPLDPPKISIEGTLGLKLPGLTISVEGGLSYGIESIEGDFKIDDFDKKFPKPLGFSGVHFQDMKVKIGLLGVQGPTIGAEGTFYIGPDKPLGLEEATRNSQFEGIGINQFQAKFSGVGGILNPIYIFLYIDRLSFQDVFKVIFNKNVSLPGFLNAIYIQQVMFHWCETLQGELKPDGTIAQPGFGLSGITTILGHNTFTELLFLPSSEIKGKLVADPINLGDGLLKIGGKGTMGTPVTYKGNSRIQPGGMEISFSSSGSPAYFTLNPEIEILGLQSVSVEGVIADDALSATIKTNTLGIVREGLSLTYKNGDYFNVKTEISTKISGLEISLGKLGNIELNTILEGKFSAIFDKGTYSNSMGLSFEFLGVRFTLSNISARIKIRDLKNIIRELESIIRDLIVKQFFENVLLWLKATLEKTYRILGDKLEEVGKLLEGTFIKTLEVSAALMREAGYVAEDVGKALNKGFKKGNEELARALKDAGYVIEDVTKVLKNVLDLAPNKAAEVLKAVGYSAVEVANALEDVYGLGEEAIIKILKAIWDTPEAIAKVLKEIYKKGPEVIVKTLKELGYTAEKALQGIQSVGKVTNEAASQFLKDAGYPIKEIKKIPGVGDVINDAGDLYDKAKETLKDLGRKLDPTNW